MKADLNEEIRRLKTEGKSLRAIATALGVSHVAVLKRMKTIEIDREIVTKDEGTESLSVTKGEENVLTNSNASQSRESERSKKAANQVVTKQTPSPGKGEGGNPSGNLFLSQSEEGKRGISDTPIDLFGAIKEFLDTNGIEVYKMQVGQEAYQAKHKEQTIRFYVQRKCGESRVPLGSVRGG